MDDNPAMREVEPAVRVEMAKELEERLDNLINRALLDALPPAQLTEFERILEEPQADPQSFLAANIPNMNEIVADVLIRFRSEYLPK
jgi:hypothetical protein